MKKIDIKQLSNNELRDRINEQRETITKSKLAHAVSPLENPQKIKMLRRDLASMLTEKRNREINNQ